MPPRFFSKKEYQDIASLFQLGTIKKLEYFSQGYQTPKVAVTTQRDKFVIAKHNLSQKRVVVADMKIVPRVALVHEIDLLNHLKSLPVPHYIRSRDQQYLEDFKGYAVSVYRFIEGRQPKTLTPKMLRQLGQFVGEFHNIGARFKKVMLGRRRFYDLNPEVMLGVKNNRLPRGLPRGPIHVDIKPDNELFVGEKLTGVIDFGNTYEDAFIFDVGKTIMWNCVKRGKLEKNLISEFLNGYSN